MVFFPNSDGTFHLTAPLTEGIEETAEKVRSRKKRMSWPFVVSETKSKETTQVT
ncbi:MAG: hypothetical protein ACJAT3_001402 [Akkermansiaceae bacterium]|jgi:hypothetical protein